MTGEVDRKEPGPRWPERGHYVRVWPFRLEVPEWAGFSMVVAFVALLVAVIVLL